MKNEVLQLVRDCENYIKKTGIDSNVVNAYAETCKIASQSGDRDLLIKCTTRAKKLVEAACMNDVGAGTWAVEKLMFERGFSYELVDRLYDILLIEARNKVVDSGFRYLERKRTPKERFYMPRRKQFLKIGLTEALQGMIDDKYDILCISLPPGTGKAQPLYSKVLTPNGFIQMGDVKIGTKVIAGNGNVANVIGVYPQGKRKIYEITLDDGSKCRCSDNHLWTVQNRCDRQYEAKTGKHRTRTLKMSDMLCDIRIDKDHRVNYSIDYVNPVDFSFKELDLHPYVMGALIGDGCFSSNNLKFSSNDKEVIETINNLLPKGYLLKHIRNYDYQINGHEGNNSKCGSLVTKALKKYGLFGKRSYEKYIPDEYMYASKEQRFWLLRGLLDTDGSCEETGIEYTTTSKSLAENIVELVHSLGGYASVKEKETHYTKGGKRIKCRNAYRITIQFWADSENVFHLKRHKEKYNPKRENVRRYITNVEYVGEEECQCIMIDDESHLYITDDYILTHNTTIEKFFACLVIGWFPNDFNLFYSHSGDITRMFYDGTLDIVTNTDDYAWNEIFPELSVTRTDAKMEQFNVQKYKPFPSMQCTSVGSKNAGKVRASKFLLVDDMIGGIEEALNPTILDKLWNKYAVDARQRKIQDTDGNNCKEIHLATRWSVNDVIGRLQRMYDGNARVKTIAVPDIDPVTGKSNFDYEFGGFTEAFFADQQLLMDDISYKCLYKQEPIEREGLLFPDDKIRRYLNLPHGQAEIITAQCDTKGKGTDYFVMPILMKYGDDYYCVDCVCDNTADYEMQYENAANALVNNEVQECEFERNAGGDRVAMEVNKRVEAKGWVCNITDVPTETNKEARIFQCSNWILQHVIFKDQSLYTPKEPYGVMMSLLKQYSVSGKKQLDDVPDVFSNFALRMTKGSRTAKVEAVQNPFRGGVGYGY